MSEASLSRPEPFPATLEQGKDGVGISSMTLQK
jgi:hypothetical protein